MSQTWDQPPGERFQSGGAGPDAEGFDDVATEPVRPEPSLRCAECGGRVGAEGYCKVCGTKAPSERDHLVEKPASWVGGVCDKGVRHPRNEDAFALAACSVPGSRAVAIVCDGVSSSDDSDVASLAAARAALAVLTAREGEEVGVLLRRATEAANEAVIAGTHPAAANAASCTLVAAVVAGDAAHIASIGDSRVYWFGDDGSSAQLTVDDSLAQEDIVAGASRDEAEAGVHGHVITAWLGLDAPELDPEIVPFEAPGPGWLCVCSDGLWNYASAPEALAEIVAACRSEAGDDPVALAEALVAWANGRGGQDNITVALIRLGDPTKG